MNILILTGKFGMGHWSASLSLRQRLLREIPGAVVTVEDFVAYAMPNVSETMYKGFHLLVTHGSGLFNTYYKMTENFPGESRPPFERLFLEKLEELIADRQPDAVIATHPLCAQLAARFKSDREDAPPLITCLTDLSSHSEWIHAGTDCYLVGSSEIRDCLVSKGVDPSRIRVTGIPVRAEFCSPCPRRGGSERHLLIMGGGLGLLPKRDRFYEALNTLPQVKTILITGGNQKLYERLAGRYPNIQVLGYTERVYDYMAWADLMLSKPGGITLFEAIFSELPILAWEPFLQQEKNNARFLVHRGIGRIAARETTACLAAIRDLIYDRPSLEAMSSRMHGLKDQLEEQSLHLMMQTLMSTKEVRTCPGGKTA